MNIQFGIIIETEPRWYAKEFNFYSIENYVLRDYFWYWTSTEFIFFCFFAILTKEICRNTIDIRRHKKEQKCKKKWIGKVNPLFMCMWQGNLLNFYFRLSVSVAGPQFTPLGYHHHIKYTHKSFMCFNSHVKEFLFLLRNVIILNGFLYLLASYFFFLPFHCSIHPHTT